jgi:hypothetical protein
MAKQTYPDRAKNRKTSQAIVQEDKMQNARRVQEAMKELARLIKLDKQNKVSD